jgi:hypothetical protein
MPSLLDKTILHFQTWFCEPFFWLKKDMSPSNLFAYLLKRFLILTAILFLNSCRQTSEKINESFLQQYGSEVEKINNIRESANQTQVNIDCQSSTFGCVDSKNRWKDSATIFGIENSGTAQSATIDTSRIIAPKPPEEFTPDVKTLMQGQSTQLPENMFHISYNLNNFPESYGRQKLSFDDINIPQQDAFGVKTELGEKNYQLIGNRTLQKDIDFTKKLIAPEDPEISLELIKQEKQIRRRGKFKTKNTTDEQTANSEVAIDKKDLTNDVENKKQPTNNSDSKPLDNIINQVTDQISKTIEDTKQQLQK